MRRFYVAFWTAALSSYMTDGNPLTVVLGTALLAHACYLYDKRPNG